MDVMLTVAQTGNIDEAMSFWQLLSDKNNPLSCDPPDSQSDHSFAIFLFYILLCSD